MVFEVVETLTQLSKIEDLSVRRRTSVMQYRGSPRNLRQIGRKLRARYVLEGGVLRAGGVVRVNVELVDAQQDEYVRAETYDRPPTSVVGSATTLFGQPSSGSSGPSSWTRTSPPPGLASPRPDSG